MVGEGGADDNDDFGVSRNIDFGEAVLTHV